MPLIWSISGCSIAAIEAIAVRTRESSDRKMSQRKRRTYDRISGIVYGDVHTCVLPEAQETCFTEIMFGVAGVMNVVKGILVTVVRSSLLFVSFLDALPILVRYEARAALCNVLLRLELAGLKCKLEEQANFHGKDTTRHFQLVEKKTGWDLELIRSIM